VGARRARRRRRRCTQTARASATGDPETQVLRGTHPEPDRRTDRRLADAGLAPARAVPHAAAGDGRPIAAVPGQLKARLLAAGSIRFSPRRSASREASAMIVSAGLAE